MMEVTTRLLPVPVIKEMAYKPMPKLSHRKDNHLLRPPKIKVGNRSILGTSTELIRTPHAISFRDLNDEDVSSFGSFDMLNNLSSGCNISDNTIRQQLFNSYDRSMNQTYFEQCFTQLSKLGQGSFGDVYKVRSKEDGLLYAVKVSKLFRSKTYRRERLEEVRRYEQFSGHANCVQFYKAWEQNDLLYMQMELCRESLEQYLERKREIPEEKIWSMLLDLLLALKSLHDRNLIHLDIKLDNVLIGDDYSCKLADFGLVVDVNTTLSHQTTEGDSRYIAPEIMEGKFTKAADIFSLGIAMLELACYLELPANGPFWQHLRKGITTEVFIKPISIELQDIIKLMMTPDYQKRPTVDQLLHNKKLTKLLKKRKRWEVVKKFNFKFRRARQLAWSKLCNLKNLFINFLTGLFSTLKWHKKKSMKILNGVEKSNATKTQTQTQTIKINTPTILCSTPTIMNKTQNLCAAKQSDFIVDDCIIEPIEKSTPKNFNHFQRHETTLNYSTPICLLRSRKLFGNVEAYNNNDMDMSLDDFETISNSNSSSLRKFDSSSLRAKKLFTCEDSD